MPTSGRYLLGGEDVAALDEARLAELRNRRIGFVFQQFHLLPYMTAARNVELPMVYAGLSPELRRERSAIALAMVGLSDRVSHRPAELSGGQQQRVAIARALVTSPDLILADEPTGNLDSTSTTEVIDLLQQLNADGRTVILITHEADIAARARRVVRIEDGRVHEATDAYAP